MFDEKFLGTICIYALSCENGLHVVDLQTTKKLKFLKTFQNLINLFSQTHNVIL